MQLSAIQEALAAQWQDNVAFVLKLFRYTGVSALALGLDVTLYALLIKSGFGVVLAAALGYLSGLVASYFLSRTIVFNSQRVGKEGAQEAFRFVLTGFVGLVISSAVVALCTSFHLGPAIAKLVAVGFSFFTVFLLRSFLVFEHAPK